MTDQLQAAANPSDATQGALPADGAKFDAAVSANSNVKSGGTHIVQEGDTLWDISKEYYGKGSEYPAIQSANSMGNSTTLTVGSPLIIPVPDNIAQNQSVTPKFAKPTGDAANQNMAATPQTPPAGSPVNTVVPPDNSVTIAPANQNFNSTATAPNAAQQSGMLDKLKTQLLDGVDNVSDMLANASSADAAELLKNIATGAVPDAVLGAVKFEFNGNVVLVAELIPTPKKGLENWDAGNSTTFIAYKGRIYTMTPNGSVETGKPIFPMQPASKMFPALENNKMAQKVLLFGNDRSGLDLDGAASPKFNLRSRNLGAIVALNDPAAKADAKRQNLAEKAIDMLVAEKMKPLEAAEMASDAVTVGIVAGSAGAATPGAIIKKAVTKTGLYFAKKEIIKEVKKEIKEQIKEGATWYAGVAYRANVQVDPKSDDPLKLQTPVGTLEGNPIPDAAQDYIMQRAGGILSNF